MKSATLSASVLSLILALSSCGFTSPVAAPADAAPIKFVNLSDLHVNGTSDSISRRSGDHYAHFCDSSNCGDSYTYVNNFGCGGTCYNGFNAKSVLLGQAGSGNPKPTGSMYTSDDCSGSYQSVGIASGQLTGCTPYSGSGTWQSAYLYYNC